MGVDPVPGRSIVPLERLAVWFKFYIFTWLRGYDGD